MTTGQAPAIATLHGIPALLGDLVAQVGGLRSRPDSDGGRTGKADSAPLPMNATAFDDASALFTHLANSVIFEAAWLDEAAPLIDAWRTESGTIVGLRSGTTPRDARDQAAGLVEWLSHRVCLLPEHALDGLLHEVAGIAARYPFRDRPTTVSTTAVCPDCRGELTEAEYARTEYRYAGILAAEKRKARSRGVAGRLAAKYAGMTAHVVA